MSCTLYSAFGTIVTLAEDVSRFKYMNNRGLTGFVDGNKNTEGEQRKTIALVGNEDPDLKNRLIFKFNSLHLQFRKVEKKGSENAKMCIWSH